MSCKSPHCLVPSKPRENKTGVCKTQKREEMAEQRFQVNSVLSWDVTLLPTLLPLKTLSQP